MASDRNDSDDPQAMETAGSSDFAGDPEIEGREPGPEQAADPGAGGGDADTEGGAGTIGVGAAEVADTTSIVAQSGDADTEGTIAEGAPSAAEGTDTEVTGAVAGSRTEPERPPAAHTTPEPDLVPDDRSAPAVDPDRVGFDGHSPVAVDDVAEEAGTGDETPPPVARKSQRTAVVVLSVLTLLVVGVGVGAWLWSRGADDPTTPPPQAQSPGPSATLSEGAFVSFTDPETGFTMRYPRGWKRSAAPVREVRLVVSDGEKYSALVRVTRTEQVTTPANLANVKAVTDGVVGPGVQILKNDPITVNGLIGYRYIYTFTDKDSGLTSAHLHYFLFQGRKMNSIVFEAVPTETFDRVSGTFDQMLGSFHSDPEPP